jgi:hypothetical protein
MGALGKLRNMMNLSSPNYKSRNRLNHGKVAPLSIQMGIGIGIGIRNEIEWELEL